MDRRRFLQLIGLAVPATVLVYAVEKKSQVDFNGKTYEVPASFYGRQPHLVATGELLDDLADVIELQRIQLETDTIFRMRVIDKLEALHGQTRIS